jgi:hypothetical protein
MAFGGKSKAAGTAEASVGDDAAGFEMGSRRGRGKDGAGAYEMVGTGSKEPA